MALKEFTKISRLNFNKVVLGITLVWFTVSCKNEVKTPQNNSQTEQKVAKKADFTGNYVTEGYYKRNEGYDWMAVMVSDAGHEQLKLSVRSRADKKSPTCTFDTMLQKFDKDTYTAIIEGKMVIFHFSEDKISIKTENNEDKDLLYFYCSGGASLEGNYSKIYDPLDQSQIDQATFNKVPNLQDIGFNISTVAQDVKTMLHVSTFGLSREFDETINIQNEDVLNAEVEDLNSDGSPELVIFTRESDGNQKANVYTFSVNNKTSMSQVFFEPTSDNKAINHGYNGDDEFALVETSLVQRFPIFENNIKTEKIRHIQYELKEGEVARKFVVKNLTDY